MPRGRRGRAAVTLPCAALAVVACLASGAIDAAGSAGAVLPARHELAPGRTVPYGIAFFGDSVSVGFGASARHRGYVGRVKSWLRGRGLRVVATVDAKGGVPVAYWEHAPMPARLDAAVVELGTNDVRLATPPARFARAYRTLTGRIRARNPRALILCLSVWPRRDGARLEGVVNRRIRAACPGTYVDITLLRARRHIRSSDGFHPNDAGYRLIARAVESRLATG